jgi:hypothetical protein
MRLQALSLSLLAALAAAPVLAQGPRAEPLPATLASPEAFAPAYAAVATPSALQVRRSGAARGGVTAAAGMLIGASAGFLASQVIWSDWDKANDGDFMSRRLTFAAGGSALGLLTGLVVGRHDPSNPARVPVRPGTRTRNTLAAAEVRHSTAITVFEMLQALRPEWLHGRGPGALRAGAVPAGNTRAGNGAEPDAGDLTTGTATPATDPNDQASASTAPRVYLDGGLVGDINALREITVHEVESIEYLDAGTATYRFGPGNTSGVILVHSGRW